MLRCPKAPHGREIHGEHTINAEGEEPPRSKSSGSPAPHRVRRREEGVDGIDRWLMRLRRAAGNDLHV